MAMMKEIKGHWPDLFEDNLVKINHTTINGNRKVIDLIPGFSLDWNISIIYPNTYITAKTGNQEDM